MRLDPTHVTVVFDPDPEIAIGLTDEQIAQARADIREIEAFFRMLGLRVMREDA